MSTRLLIEEDQPARSKRPRGTVWSWLSDDAIKPWQHRSRDPKSPSRPGRNLDLYGGHY